MCDLYTKPDKHPRKTESASGKVLAIVVLVKRGASHEYVPFWLQLVVCCEKN